MSSVSAALRVCRVTRCDSISRDYYERFSVVLVESVLLSTTMSKASQPELKKVRSHLMSALQVDV